MKLVAKKHQGIVVLIAGLVGLITLGVQRAEASPPSPRGETLTRVSVDTPRSAGASAGAQNERQSEREYGRLDLRVPSDFTAARSAADSGAERSASESEPFPSVRHASKDESTEEPLSSRANSGFGDTTLAMKNTSRAEELTRRIHREGLPLARLWETRSALVSVGLSPRGKPGIWLTQKIP